MPPSEPGREGGEGSAIPDSKVIYYSDFVHFGFINKEKENQDEVSDMDISDTTSDQLVRTEVEYIDGDSNNQIFQQRLVDVEDIIRLPSLGDLVESKMARICIYYLQKPTVSDLN